MSVCGDKAGFVLEDYEDYKGSGPDESKPEPHRLFMKRSKCKKGGKRR
jgi:hypothetical protein